MQIELHKVKHLENTDSNLDSNPLISKTSVPPSRAFIPETDFHTMFFQDLHTPFCYGNKLWVKATFQLSPIIFLIPTVNFSEQLSARGLSEQEGN